MAIQSKFGHKELDQMMLDANNWQPDQLSQQVPQQTPQSLIQRKTQPNSANNQGITG